MSSLSEVSSRRSIQVKRVNGPSSDRSSRSLYGLTWPTSQDEGSHDFSRGGWLSHSISVGIGDRVYAERISQVPKRAEKWGILGRLIEMG